MVKRFALLLLPLLCLAVPASAQDYPVVEMSFGYGNFSVEDPEGSGGSARVHGFAMHSGFNFKSWMGIDNYTGAYSVPADITLIVNTVGLKIAARDLIEGRITPYVIAGIGVGYFTSEATRSGFSTTATSLGGGIDFNLGGGVALRIDASRIGLSNGLVTPGWKQNVNISAGLVFNLAGGGR